MQPSAAHIAAMQCGNRISCAGRFMTAFLEAFDAKEWNGFKRDWFNQRAFNKCLSMPCFKGQKLQKLQQIEEFLQEGLQDAADSAALL